MGGKTNICKIRSLLKQENRRQKQKKRGRQFYMVDAERG